MDAIGAIDKKLGYITKWMETTDNRLNEHERAIKINIERIDNMEEEMIWRDRKKRQALVNGVGESNAKTDKARADEDKAAVAQVFEAMGCPNMINDTKFVRRIGKATPGKDRPICVGFYDEATRDQALRYARNLKDSRFKDVNVQADLTKAQRKTFKKQLEEVKRMNAAKEGLEEGQEWRVVGPRGDTRVIRATIRK